MSKEGFLEKNWVFAFCWASLSFLGLGLIAFWGKDQSHLMVVQWHHAFLDSFFRFYTDFATTGFTLALVGFLIFRGSYKQLLTFVIAFLLLTLISTLVKNCFFEFVHRPTYYFQLKNILLRDIEGVRRQIPYTFPSGHTMNAFLSFGFAANLTRKKGYQLLFFVLAFLVAYSRVYLSKHFILDTIGGALLGYMGMIFIYLLCAHYVPEKWNKPILRHGKA